MQQSWRELTLIGFDTETTGKYPLYSEVCELAAVKWRAGEVVDRFQTLVRPKRPMNPTAERVHGITSEMLVNAPYMDEVIQKFHQFIQHGILVAHHAPFDLGFLAWDFERFDLPLPDAPVLCSSLLSRKLIPESGNHRLQTLIQHLRLEQGQAHRALDDAKACLDVALHCFQRLGEKATLEEIVTQQGGPLNWQRFSIRELQKDEDLKGLVESLELERPLEFVYSGGSKPGKARVVKPEGLVRNPDGDYMVAKTGNEFFAKRYYLAKVKKTKAV